MVDLEIQVSHISCPAFPLADSDFVIPVFYLQVLVVTG